MAAPRIVTNQLALGDTIDWNDWSFSEVTDPDSVLSYSISGDGSELTITVDASASSSSVRMIAGKNVSTVAGKTNAMSIEVVAISGDWSDLDIVSVTASGTTSGDTRIRSPSAVGRFGKVFELAADDTDVFRVGLGCAGNKTVTGARSITLKHPQFENDLDAGTVAPSEFTPGSQPSAFAYEQANTLTNELIGEVEGDAIDVDKHSVIMTFADSQGNSTAEWPGLLRSLLSNTVVVIDGLAGRTLQTVADSHAASAITLGTVRLSDEVLTNKFHSKAIKPSAFVVQLGVNDVNASRTAAQIYADFLTLRNVLGSRAPIILCTISPWEGAASGSAAETTVTLATNVEFAKAAKEFSNVFLVDLATLSEDTTNTEDLRSDFDSGDGLHINSTGSTQWSRAIALQAKNLSELLVDSAEVGSLVMTGDGLNVKLN